MMRSELIEFINQSHFPCIMAKKVSQRGHLQVHQTQTLDDISSIIEIQRKIYHFIDSYHSKPNLLHSFVITIKDNQYQRFSFFEEKFWNFLTLLRYFDQLLYDHDDRVSSDPLADDFSFSLGEEAFFILTLHPKSPRLSRRYTLPTIVLNPHQQFETLRNKGAFARVRDIIRKKDKLLQGFINPMLSDFGSKSEVFQYTGRVHSPDEELLRGLNENYPPTSWSKL